MATAQTKTQKTVRYALYGLLVLFAGSLTVFFFIVRPIQIHNQKQNFAKAEASLDDLEKQIEAKVGKPDQIKKDKSCGYANRLNEKGPRRCSVSINILYAHKDLVFANNTLESATVIMGSKLNNQLLRSKETRFVPYDGRGPSQSFTQTISSSGALNCSIQYLYPVVPLHDKSFPDTSGENIEMSLSCGGPAKAEYFPVKD